MKSTQTRYGSHSVTGLADNGHAGWSVRGRDTVWSDPTPLSPGGWPVSDHPTSIWSPRAEYLVRLYLNHPRCLTREIRSVNIALSTSVWALVGSVSDQCRADVCGPTLIRHRAELSVAADVGASVRIWNPHAYLRICHVHAVRAPAHYLHFNPLCPKLCSLMFSFALRCKLRH